MPQKIRWGVLGAAKIATKKVIPAMQRCQFCEVAAIASREEARARDAATELRIPRWHSSYEELLADPGIDAIYNPLPNDLHVPWSAKAAEAGKHVLCEKPIALTAEEARELIAVRDRTGVKIGEAFMVRTHPQWLKTRKLIRDGAVGKLRAITSVFSYFNDDERNIRNIPAHGGGAIYDIGCYPVTMSRFLFEREPERVIAVLQRDPEMHVDRLSSAILDFGWGQATFTCSTQLAPFQRLQVFGSKARIEVEIPYNIPMDEPSRIFFDDGSKLAGRSATIEHFAIADQYTIQGDQFARAILDNSEVPVPLEDAVANMRVLDALFRSAETGRWEAP